MSCSYGRPGILIPKIKFTSLWAGAAITLAFCLAVTTLLVGASRRSIEEQADQRFGRLADRVITETVRRANLSVYGMGGARGVFATSDKVDARQFAAYVASRNLPVEFPGTRGFGFIERVHRPRGDGFVVKFFGPAEWDRGMPGLDVGADPVCRPAIDQAINEGTPVATGLREISGNGRSGRGYWYLLPVFKNGVPHQNSAERQRNLTGVLFTPILVADALRGVTGTANGSVSLQIFDGGRAAPDTELYDSDVELPLGGARAGARDSNGTARFDKRCPVTVAGRTWLLRTTSTSTFESWIDHRTPWVLGSGGVLLSVMFTALVWSLGLARTRAVEIAVGMTADLSRAKIRAELAAVELAAQAVDMKATAAILRRTGEMARVGGWELELATQKLTWTDQVYHIHEIPVGSPIDVPVALAFYAPEDRLTIEEALEAARKNHTVYDLELPMATATGRRIWVRAFGEAVAEGDTVVKLCGAFQDITQRRLAEDQLRNAATHDRLTGLPNRAMLEDRLMQAIRRSARTPGRGFAVLFLDFDRFKRVNDKLGHDAGDELLCQIAGRLRRSLRPADSVGVNEVGSMAARLGGDEFVVILEDLASAKGVRVVAERLLKNLSEPYQLASHIVDSTASIGIATSFGGCQNAEQLLRDADKAMYQAKQAGRGGYVVFASDQPVAKQTCEGLAA